MKKNLLLRIFDRHTLACYFGALALMLFLAGGKLSSLSFFLGFAPEKNSFSGLDILKAMEWNLCVLPPVAASMLFLMPELGLLSTYTIMRSKNICRWWLMRLTAVIIINYVFFFFVSGLLYLLPGSDVPKAEWCAAAALFPLHTTLLSVLCAVGMILFSSRAAVILYLIAECGLLAAGTAYFPFSFYLLPFWGMARAMGDHLVPAAAVSLFLIIITNLGILCILSRHNPAANPQSK